MSVAGSTALLAAGAAGAVGLWPSAAAAPLPPGQPLAAGLDSAGLGAARTGQTGATSSADGSQVLASQSGLYLASRAHAAAMSEQAAARRAAAKRAARRRAARLAAQRARQQAEQAQQATAPADPAATSAPSGSAAPAAPSGTPQQIAESMLGSFGWSSGEFSCLDLLWNAESGWNVYASNPVSGAYGIPQALPGAKMASAGPDWQSDAATQIRWGLEYIQSDYGSPCAAWDHEQSDGWY